MTQRKGKMEALASLKYVAGWTNRAAISTDDTVELRGYLDVVEEYIRSK